MYGFQINEWNKPLPLPSVYLITDQLNQKQYIGSSELLTRRIWQHSRAKENQEMHKIISEFGTERFKVEPLYYAFEKDRLHLLDVETQLIKDWESLTPKGYNFTLYTNDANHRSAIANAVAAPESRAKHSETNRTRYLDPLERQKTSIATKRGCTPERNAKIFARRINQIWVTDGEENKSQDKNVPIPTGWRRGKVHRKKLAPEHGEKISAARQGTISITNGITNKWVKSSDPIPQGWRRGQHH